MNYRTNIQLCLVLSALTFALQASENAPTVEEFFRLRAQVQIEPQIERAAETIFKSCLEPAMAGEDTCRYPLEPLRHQNIDLRVLQDILIKNYNLEVTFLANYALELSWKGYGKTKVLKMYTERKRRNLSDYHELLKKEVDDAWAHYQNAIKLGEWFDEGNCLFHEIFFSAAKIYGLSEEQFQRDICEELIRRGLKAEYTCIEEMVTDASYCPTPSCTITKTGLYLWINDNNFMLRGFKPTSS